MKAFVAIFLSAMVAFAGVPTASVFAKEKKDSQALVDNVKSAILLEKDTGKVLYSKNMDKELPPASMTKIMTLLLIFKALDNKTLSLDEKVQVSEHAASMGGSQIFLEAGEKMTVNDLLKAIAIGSANDASMAMAEHLAGSEKSFVKKMNKEAKALGLKHTHFSNPTGLPTDDHYSTAHDMAMMAKALLNYPEVLKYTSTYEDYLRENTDKKFWLVNTNKMLKTYQGIDGLKTGFTQEAKYCLTATAKRNGMRVIAVVMGAPTPKERNKEVASMLNYAFAHFQTKELVPKGKVMRQVQVNKSKEGTVPVVTQLPVVYLKEKGKQNEKIHKEIIVHKNLKAPMKAGTPVGYYIVSSKDEILSKTPLVVREDVHKAKWWHLFKRSIGKMTNGSW
ncbi:D-alanyl-D-alanine carboxypeptidase (penicillin-binding protein 5/6) [Pullulanibacillus pueri]|uniref:serine-type D-Ala-D-Ala carboxypeptidase n=1 Tax=Pullulanibacillus pueri TaxID=1437324 RepID=A0A8J3ELG1_9BACL|nr:D-alanyl-D-alanine carboxypeptidase family protein [Pullulanibacillus pueri]MBM7681526.1 D-alanyl-D-alanine carboxypeptidase (penicillin-binding protein 5/6) [Pullulanibacillus pueri]GGH79232.1 D-alanyl-D-alanine carboxypeptidase [Pullulanibacillus pueri]